MSDPFIAKPFKAAPNLKKLSLPDATFACEKIWLEFLSRLQRAEGRTKNATKKSLRRRGHCRNQKLIRLPKHRHPKRL